MSEKTCARHPDKPARHYCAKYDRWLCDDCATCQDPTLFCRHRSMCVINEMDKQNKARKSETDEA